MMMCVINLSFVSEYDELIQKHIDFRISDTYDEINIGLNKNLYSIEIEYEVVDTFYTDPRCNCRRGGES